ncbi:MAG: hypothetical protein KJO51_08615, partial [Gramella sp.]|nr:hypothetical protein [Christiangramia sp.]
MENFGLVQQKLEAFIRKYYVNLILKGSILFVAIGLLYFLLMVSLEYFFWLSSTGRSILFWFFILLEILQRLIFVLIRLFKILKISGGIDQFQASEIIGFHFPEVSDKLTNLLQLKNDKNRSDLLIASIDQRSKELTPIPFSKAIDLKDNKRFLPYVIFPVIIVLALIIAGKSEVITKSFNRISNYNTAYVKPAPFSFVILNDELKAREGENFKFQVRTVGDFNPESVQLLMEGNETFMKQTAPGIFEYTFSDLSEDLNFKLLANEVGSPQYILKVIKVPKLLNFEMELDYPSYTGLNDENISGTGNVTIPEGTVIKWNFLTRNTKTINFKTPDTLLEIKVKDGKTSLSKQLRGNLPYSVSSSNDLVNDFENLEYSVKVIKDEFPEIKIVSEKDSLNSDIQY